MAGKMIKRNGKIRMVGLFCRSCGQVVISLARHDYRHCPCGKAFIDGGQENYYRYGAEKMENIALVDVWVPMKDSKTPIDKKEERSIDRLLKSYEEPKAKEKKNVRKK